jgi:hypothetical protein
MSGTDEERSRSRGEMEDLSGARKRYADLIRQTAQLRSERLVRALIEVPREDYLGPGPWKTMRYIFPLKYEETPDANPVHVYDDVLVAHQAQVNNLRDQPNVRRRSELSNAFSWFTD